MKRFNPWAFVVLFAVAGMVSAAIINYEDNGQSVSFGDYSTGTKLNLIEAFDVSFVNATSGTASSDAGSTYYIAASWKSSSADPGKVTTAISGGTLTVTTANATTGTCSVLVFGAP